MITDTDRAMMRLALAEAEQALAAGEIPVGCVIVKDGEVLVRARNARETIGDPTAHAEILALREAARVTGDWRLTGCTMYVTLEPCPMCAGAVLMSRVSRLVYGAADEAAGCAGSVYRLPEDPALPWFTETESGLYRTECAELLARFFAGKRNK